MRISFKAAILGCHLLIAFAAVHAQQIERLSQVVPDLKEVVTFEVGAQEVDFLNPFAFGFCTKGLVAITKDRVSLVCYRSDGTIVWQRQPPEGVISAVHSSDDGSTIAAYCPLTEDQGVTEVLTSEGEVLWRKAFDGAFAVSPTGKYLYSGPSALSHMPLTVLEGRTGAILWRGSESDFRAELLNEETIVYVIRGTILIMEMSSGKLLEEHSFEEHFDTNELNHLVWYLEVSESGNSFTMFARSAISDKKLIQSYNDSFERQWMEVLETEGSAKLLGVSEDGSRCLITHGYDLRLFDTLSGELLWKIENGILSNRPVVTNELIALGQVGYESELFLLDESGRVIRRIHYNAAFYKTKISKGLVGLSKPYLKRPSLVEIKQEGGFSSLLLYERD